MASIARLRPVQVRQSQSPRKHWCVNTVFLVKEGRVKNIVFPLDTCLVLMIVTCLEFFSGIGLSYNALTLLTKID